MASSGSTIDINRTTSISSPCCFRRYFAEDAGILLVMRLARRIALPGLGVTVPIITGDPEAGWVGETEKNRSSAALSGNQADGLPLAVIVPFSNQFRRDAKALYDAMVQRLPGVLARSSTPLFSGAADVPGSNFDSLAKCTAQSILTDAYGGLVAADARDIADHDGIPERLGSFPEGEIHAADCRGWQQAPAVHQQRGGWSGSDDPGRACQAEQGAYIAETASADAVVEALRGDWTRRGCVHGTVEGGLNRHFRPGNTDRRREHHQSV